MILIFASKITGAIRLRTVVEPIRIDDYTGKKMTFFSEPDGLPLEIHE